MVAPKRGAASKTAIATPPHSGQLPILEAAPSVSTPTAIPGVRRKRIEVSAADLRKLAPGVGSDIVNRAVHQLSSLVAEGATDRMAVLWGHTLQADHSALVSEALNLAQDETLVRVTGYVERMVAILNAIDLEALSTGAAGAGLSGYLKRLNTKIDTPIEVDAARLELGQLLSLMAAAMEPLLQLKETIGRQSERIEQTGLDIEAAALAAEYLASQYATTRNDLSQRFVERAMSLTQTVAQIRSGAPLRRAQIEQPLNLISAIQNVALVSIPAWLSSLAALTAARSGPNGPTPTEARELSYKLRAILQHLKA